MALGLGLALALILALDPSGAEAGSIHWEVPAACPDAQWLEQRVGAYLGRPLAGEAEVTLIGRVYASEGRFTLELETRVAGVHDRQRLEHQDCRALVEIAASLAAIAIDPLAQPPLDALAPEYEPPDEPAEPAEPPDEPPDEPLAPPPPSPPAPPAPELLIGPLAERGEDSSPRAEAPRRTRLLLGANAGLALNLFPNPAPQVHGSLGLAHGGPRAAVRVDVAGGAALAGRFRASEGSIGGDLSAWDVGLRPCAVPRWGLVELRACAAIGAGQIRARGVGVSNALRRAHPWLWLAAEAGVGVELRRDASVVWALVLDLGAGFNLLRPNFNITGTDAAFATPIVSGLARLGVELRFF
jgi:hypothetical protein